MSDWERKYAVVCQVRMYPALNMDEKVLLDGLALKEEAIAHAERNGVTMGDYPPMPGVWLQVG